MYGNVDGIYDDLISSSIPSGAATGMSLVMMLLYLGVFVFSIVIMWKMYSKAGEAGWKCLIPFYSSYILCKIARKTKMFILILISALVAVISCATLFGGMFEMILSGGESGISSFFVSMFVVFIAAIVSGIAQCIVYYNVGKCFGMGSLFNVLMIFFTPICIAIIAFNRNIQYVGGYTNQPINYGPSGPNYYGGSNQNPYNYNNPNDYNNRNNF